MKTLNTLRPLRSSKRSHTVATWLAVTAAAFILQACASAPAERSVPALTLSSQAFKQGQRLADDQVANTFGCTGKNISPDVQWSGAPAETKFYAVSIYDPDAPTGSGFWHWVVFNIPASVTSLKADAGKNASTLPPGATMARNDGGAAAFAGACPPVGHGEHRYILRVFALSDKLPLDGNASPALVGFMINQMKLAEGSITAKYSR